MIMTMMMIIIINCTQDSHKKIIISLLSAIALFTNSNFVYLALGQKKD